jgi:hypothetical protein
MTPPPVFTENSETHFKVAGNFLDFNQTQNIGGKSWWEEHVDAVWDAVDLLLS